MSQKQRIPAESSKTPDQAQTGNKAAAEQAKAIQEAIAPALEHRKLSEIKDKKERLLELANIIERNELVKHGIGFNMAVWGERAVPYNLSDWTAQNTGHVCGTVACIAGWTVAQEKVGSNRENEGIPLSTFWGAADKAQRILELTDSEAHHLFYAPMAETGRGRLSVERAVAVIRNLAETGKVEWAAFNNRGERR